MIDVRQLFQGKRHQEDPAEALNGAAADFGPARINPVIGKQIVVAGGCARSGTTALARMINFHPECAMSYERYTRLYKQGWIAPEHYTRAKMADPPEGDPLHGLVKPQTPELVARFDDAKIVGDKFPLIYLAYDTIFDNLEGAKIVYILRNPLSVAESYQTRAIEGNPTGHWDPSRDFRAGVAEWNESVQKTVAAKERYGDRIGVFAYEHVHYNKAASDRLFEFLEVEPLSDELFARSLRAHLQNTTTSKDMLRYVFLNADIDSYRTLSNLALDRDL